MRIVSWNINSVRLRQDLVARLASEAAPDVICLQEIKCLNDQFPLGRFRELGYRHAVLHGVKGYHGVAILSRVPFAASGTRDWCDRVDGRHVHATLEDGTEVHNVYVPAGGDIPDPAVNDKFAHKLQFLSQFADWWAAERAEAKARIMVGDLNVAPLETDVWSHKQMLSVVSHTPVEVDHLGRLQAAHGWIDAVRHFVPPEEKLFSWWSYRARDWAASDRGRRLDHVWVTAPLAPALKSARVLKDARGWDRPSDHVPVVVDIG